MDYPYVSSLMPMSGGGGGGDFAYQVIDFGGNVIEYNGDDVTISGIYNAVSNIDTNSPVLIKNIKLTLANNNVISTIPFWATRLSTTSQGSHDVYTLWASLQTTNSTVQSVKLQIFYDDVVFWG